MGWQVALALCLGLALPMPSPPGIEKGSGQSKFVRGVASLAPFQLDQFAWPTWRLLALGNQAGRTELCDAMFALGKFPWVHTNRIRSSCGLLPVR